MPHLENVGRLSPSAAQPAVAADLAFGQESRRLSSTWKHCILGAKLAIGGQAAEPQTVGQVLSKGNQLRIIFASSVLLAIILSSCSSLPTSEPTSIVSISPTPSETLSPTQTFTPEPTATETPQIIPEYMSEYIERGFDTVSTDSLLCFVVDKTKVHYSPLEGIIYKERVIRSWLEVEYIRDGELHHGIVLEFVRRGGSVIHKDLTKITWSGSGSSFVNPSVAFVERMHNAWSEYTPTQYTIGCGILGINLPSEIPQLDGIDFSILANSFEANASTISILFEGFFPVVDGKAQPVTIQEIGEVLPITHFFTLRDLLMAEK